MIVWVLFVIRRAVLYGVRVLCAVCVCARVLALCVVCGVASVIGLFTCFVRAWCVSMCSCAWFYIHVCDVCVVSGVVVWFVIVVCFWGLNRGCV